jgi:hypothetical protein
MPTMETNLDGTLREVIGETLETSRSNSGDTKKGISSGSASETKSGDTDGENIVQGIDISDVPEQYRNEFKAKLGEKFKLADKGINEKFQEIAKFKKAQDDLQSMGLSVDEAREVLSKHAEQKKNPTKTTEEKKTAIRKLDALIENSSSDQRQALEDMRQIILEETDISSIKKDLAELKQFYQRSAFDASSRRKEQINSELDKLKDTLGDVVDKYRDEVVKQGVNYNNAPTKRLLYAIADPDELDQSILNQKSKTTGKPLTEEKRNAISSSNSGISGSKGNLDAKKMSLKGLISELSKK